MASIRRRGDGWQVQIALRGKRLSATFATRKDAEDWARTTEGGIIEGDAAPIVPLRRGVTVEALFSRYAALISPTKRGVRWEQIRLKALARNFDIFRGTVESFTAPALCEWRDRRLCQVSAYTVNRELNLISAVMNVARKEWHVVGLLANPVHSVTRPSIPRARKQRVSADQKGLILAALNWDGVSPPATSKQWVGFAFALAIETAMRKGEILAIVWRHVHLDKRTIHLPHTKNGHERNVPLSSRAVLLLRLLKPGKAADRLVPIHSGYLDSLFRKARDEAGLPTVRFHDSRREAATVMSKKLSNVLELAAVTGHRSLHVLKGYYEPDPEDLADKLG